MPIADAGKASRQQSPVMKSAAGLQQLLPDAVRVGGYAAPVDARHRGSSAPDPCVADLGVHFAVVLDALESDEGWAFSRAVPGKRILGRLGGIETDVRPMIRTEWPAEAGRTAVERASLGEWRRLAEASARSAWGRIARQAVAIVADAEPDPAQPGSDLGASVARRLAQLVVNAPAAAERAEVMGEMRALVARSGLTRAAFAAALGASVSRLPASLTGRVVPSAALMVRMGRVAGRPGGEVETPPGGRWPPRDSA